jgi:hypothetical protein
MRIAIKLNSTNLEVPLEGGQVILTHSIRHVLLPDASVCNLLVGMLARRDHFHDQGIPKLHGFPGRRQAHQDRNNPGYSETASKKRLEFFASGLISPENSHRRTDIGWRPASLSISQVFKLVKCSPVASCLGSSLPGEILRG